MLYIMRHGLTEWNASHRLQGGSDVPLNDAGRQMAIDAGKRYKDVKFDICYASPLCRAKETAELVLKGRDVPIFLDERLREMSFGKYEGRQNIFEHPDWPIYSLFKAPQDYIADDDCETFQDLYKRTGEFVDEVLVPELEKGKNVLIVGHGAMNLSIINRALGIPMERYWEKHMENCEVLSIEYPFKV